MSKQSLLVLIAIMLSPNVLYSQDVKQHALPATQLHRITTHDPQGLQALFRYTGDPLPLVSAHRGGPQAEYPENCIATFQNTLQHTFAILEIDPRYTKDGAIVVIHDATLQRTTTGSGPVAERTLEELKALRLKDTTGAATEFQIPTLDEVLRWARGRTILVLDQKTVPVAARVKKIEEHRAESYAMLIVYTFKDVQACYKLNKDIMMEVMIPNREKFQQFDKTGVPWSNIVAFVGHTPPQDKELLQMIHAKGACCIVGTSRNLDREFAKNLGSGAPEIEQDYRALLEGGADLIETDLPRELGALLYREAEVPPSKSKYFR